jgi:hypothetical protein
MPPLLFCSAARAPPAPPSQAQLRAVFRALDEGSQWAFRAAVAGDSQQLARGAASGAALDAMIDLATKAGLADVQALLSTEARAQVCERTSAPHMACD